MGSIKHRPHPTVAPTPGIAPDDVDELRSNIYERLQTDRMQLVTLSAALAQAEEDPAPIFGELLFLAHVLHGGAATLEIPEVTAAANSLEQAASCAMMSNADNTDSSVWTALVTLVSVMNH